MNKNWVLLLILALFTSSCSLNIQKRHALYGERKYKWTVQDRTERIFLDKEGLYYPDIFISDKELKAVNGSLRDWYHRNPVKLTGLCRQYSVDSTGSDIDAIIERVNDAVVKKHAEVINLNMQHFSTINVLVHGYRKKAYGSFPGITRTSRKDNQKLAGSLTLGSHRDVFYVEVYWDGYFFGIGHNSKQMANAFHSYATPSAVNAGIGLRKLLTKIKQRDINIVTHDLGALVGCEALFNASAAVLPEAVAMENTVSTPAQNPIKFCMIAPAIGSEVFANYNKRNPDVATGKDNYKVSVVYNEYDLAMLKHYKGLVLSYGHLSPVDSGNTSLGCNYNGDVGKMMSAVSPANVDTFNLSKNGKKKAKGQSLVGCYLKNEAKFQQVADYIGERKVDEDRYVAEMLEKQKHLTGAAKRAYEAKMREEARKQLDAKRKADAIAREKQRKEREAQRKIAERERMKERERATAERKAAERQRMSEKAAENKAKAMERDRIAKEREAERRANEKAKAAERDRLAAEKRAADKEKEAEKRRIEKEKAEAKRIADKATAEQKKQEEADRRAAEKQREEARKAAEKEKREAEKAKKK